MDNAILIGGVYRLPYHDASCIVYCVTSYDDFLVYPSQVIESISTLPFGTRLIIEDCHGPEPREVAKAVGAGRRRARWRRRWKPVGGGRRR